MQIIKRIMPVIFIAIFLALNTILNYILVNANGASEVMWKDFRNEKTIDTVYLGSSFSQVTFNPYIIDEKLGWKSFNMGTPAQPLDQSYVALQNAIKEKKIKRAVLAYGIPTMEDTQNDNARITFAHAMKYGCSLKQKVKMDWDFITDKENINTESSINYLFPWISNSIEWTKTAIENNIKLKKHNNDATENMKTTEWYASYIGKGYAPILTGGFDYKNAITDNTKANYNCIISETAYCKLEKICRLCKDNEVEFIIVNTPKAPYDISMYGADEYFAINSRIEEICTKYGFSYYDFNLIKPEIFQICPEYLNNYEHLSKAGSEAFCNAFSNFIRLHDSGECMTNYFYNEEEYLDSVKDIVQCIKE